VACRDRDPGPPEGSPGVSSSCLYRQREIGRIGNPFIFDPAERHIHSRISSLPWRPRVYNRDVALRPSPEEGIWRKMDRECPAEVRGHFLFQRNAFGRRGEVELSNGALSRGGVPARSRWRPGTGGGANFEPLKYLKKGASCLRAAASGLDTQWALKFNRANADAVLSTLAVCPPHEKADPSQTAQTSVGS
jgi:hypothetical protein